MKMTRGSSPYKSPGMRKMAEGGNVKPKRKVVTTTGKEITGKRADKIRKAKAEGKSEVRTGLFGLGKRYKIKPDEAKPKVSTKNRTTKPGAATKKSVRPKARPGTYKTTEQEQKETLKQKQRTTRSTPTSPNRDKKTTTTTKKTRTGPNDAAKKFIKRSEGSRKSNPTRTKPPNYQRTAKKSSPGQLEQRTNSYTTTQNRAAYSTQETNKRAVDKARASNTGGGGKGKPITTAARHKATAAQMRDYRNGKAVTIGGVTYKKG